MINALRMIAWSFILVLAAIAGFSMLAYIAKYGINERVMLGALLGVIALAVSVWYWLIYRR